MVNTALPYSRRTNRLTSAASNSVEAANDTYVDVSPITGESITWKKVILQAAEIDKTIIKSKYNKRSHKHISRAAVNDILPEIEAQKRNTNFCRGLRNRDKIELLEGMRRCASVNYAVDASLYVWVADSLTEQEQKHYAQSSDVYRQPTQLDIGFSALEVKSEYESRSETIKDYQLADMFSLSAGKMSESLKSASLPLELIDLFPAFEFVGARWLRTMLTFQKTLGNGGIADAIRDLNRLDEDSSTIEDDSQQMQKKITALLQEQVRNAPKSSQRIEKWRDVKADNSINIAVDSKGKVKLSFDPDKLSEELQDKLLEIMLHNQK